MNTKHHSMLKIGALLTAAMLTAACAPRGLQQMVEDTQATAQQASEAAQAAQQAANQAAQAAQESRELAAAAQNTANQALSTANATQASLEQLNQRLDELEASR